MNRQFLKLRTIIIVILILLTITGLFFANYFYAKNYPGGKNFQTQWIATRATIFENESPYSDSVLYKIQLSAYGRPAMSGEFEFGFNYPFFALAVFLPFGLIKSLAVARAAWMLVLEILVVLTYLLSINLGNWKPNLRTNVLLFSFFVTFYHTLRVVIDGNLIVLTTLLLIASLICIRDRHDEAAGMLLLGLALEIQFTFVILLIILCYAVINKRPKILNYFIGSLIILLGFSFLLRPDWSSGYFTQLSKSIFDFSYSSIGGTLKSILGAVGSRLAITISIMMVILLIIESYLAQKKSFRHFIWFIFLSLIIIQWAGLPSYPGNFFLLMPGLIFSMQVINERWKLKGEMIIFLISIILYISIWVLFFVLGNGEPAYVESSLFFVIFPLVEILLLYWAKWWINKNPAI